MTVPNDPLYARQWHLPMIGNVARIWDDYTGQGVTVALYDDGLQYTHPDLAAHYDASRHFRFNGTTYDPMPPTRGDAHGTACAGLIGAVADNGLGGAGVAPGVTLTAMNYLGDLQNAYDWDRQETSALYDAAMRWAAGFDIMSNSWGTRPEYADELNLNEPGNGSAVDAVHFEWVAAHGRGGLGTIIVKAAGNESMNANGDGTNASRHTITVAAVKESGFVAGYSNFGSSILIAGPAASYTTDLVGNRGYNSSGGLDGDSLGTVDYTSTFNGTSAATPVVAGVAALMLEANAGLGWRDVQSILALSAHHTGSAIGAAARGAEEGTWLTMAGQQWNGGGAIYHASYGFGMVDAFAAVRMAEVWSRLFPEAQTSANERHIAAVYDGFSITIPDSDGLAASPEAKVVFAVEDSIRIDSVQVTLGVRHSFSGDLVIVLRSPTGEEIKLFNREGGGSLMDGLLRWTFAAEAFRGMDSAGTWEVWVHDRSSSDTGRIYDARLDFFGADASADDVFHFTDDFAMLRDVQAERRLIDDADGGSDWLNFAAATGDLALDMRAGGALRVDGQLMARLMAGEVDFEHAQGGDGDDRVTGNRRANDLYGGRGNDSLAGGSKADLLDGERGNDTLRGGAGADVFQFGTRAGQDRIADWTAGVDGLRLDEALWGGGKTAAEVVAEFGAVEAGHAVLTFAGAVSITLLGLGSLTGLAEDITLI